jgi:hypothetical protein
VSEREKKTMIPMHTAATKSKKLAKTPYMLGLTLLTFTCCSSIVMAEDAGVRDAIFVGVIDKPGITPSDPVVNSQVKPFFPTLDPTTYGALKGRAAAASRGRLGSVSSRSDAKNPEPLICRS